jgi:hypothetical protein
MKITGYRTLRTVHDWGRAVGDVNGFIASGVTDVPIVILETDEGVEGVGMGSHADLERLFPALEGQDPRAVSSLYDAMLARVFKTSHAGGTFGGVGAFDTALWDLKSKIAGEPLWRLLGAADRFVPGYASALDIALSDDELNADSRRRSSRAAAASSVTCSASRWSASRCPEPISCSTPTSRGTSVKRCGTSRAWRRRSTSPGSRSRCAAGTPPATPVSPRPSVPPSRRART